MGLETVDVGCCACDNGIREDVLVSCNSVKREELISDLVRALKILLLMPHISVYVAMVD